VLIVVTAEVRCENDRVRTGKVTNDGELEEW